MSLKAYPNPGDWLCGRHSNGAKVVCISWNNVHKSQHLARKRQELVEESGDLRVKTIYDCAHELKIITDFLKLNFEIIVESQE